MASRKKITVHLTPLQLVTLFEAAMRALTYDALSGRESGATRRGAQALNQAFNETEEEWPL